jgi:hypothetical protein
LEKAQSGLAMILGASDTVDAEGRLRFDLKVAPTRGSGSWRVIEVGWRLWSKNNVLWHFVTVD